MALGVEEEDDDALLLGISGRRTVAGGYGNDDGGAITARALALDFEQMRRGHDGEKEGIGRARSRVPWVCL